MLMTHRPLWVTFKRSLPAKLAFLFTAVLASYMDEDFRESSWAQIVAGLVILLLFFGGVMFEIVRRRFSKPRGFVHSNWQTSPSG